MHVICSTVFGQWNFHTPEARVRREENFRSTWRAIVAPQGTPGIPVLRRDIKEHSLRRIYATLEGLTA